MTDCSLDFVDPTGLDVIEENLDKMIDENERYLEKPNISPKLDNKDSGLEEFPPSVMERAMEEMRPCIEETSKYLEKYPSKTVSKSREKVVKSPVCQRSKEKKFGKMSIGNNLGMEANKTVPTTSVNSVKSGDCQSFNGEWSDNSCVFVEKSEVSRVCLGQCIKQVPVEKVSEIQPGDHLVYQRPGYQHHAIVVNVIQTIQTNDYVANITVIHKSGNVFNVTYGLLKYVATIGQSSPKGCLKEETFENVNVKKTELFVVKYKTYPYSPKEIICRARDQLSKSKSSEYNLANNNCEHIVTWCVTGEWYSDQIHSLWINVMNKFKPFCEDTASMEKVEEMKRCDLICDECYTKCKLKKT